MQGWMRNVPTLAIVLVLSVCIVYTVRTSSNAILKSKPTTLDELSDAMKVAGSTGLVQRTNPGLSKDIIEMVRKMRMHTHLKT